MLIVETIARIRREHFIKGNTAVSNQILTGTLKDALSIH
jgi:hypothetical protein